MGKTLLRGGLLIDGKGDPPIDQGVILIERQRIIGVGKEEELRERADAMCWTVATKRFFRD